MFKLNIYFSLYSLRNEFINEVKEKVLNLYSTSKSCAVYVF